MPVGTVGVQCRRGMQIAYVPRHAEGNLKHPDVEVGFVTSVKPNGAFCRFWTKGSAGSANPELRTKANSELTPFDCLVVIDPYPSRLIKQLLETM